MNKVELLAPAGSFEKAKTAFLYGADAVYCGTGSLSLRSRAEVKDDDLAETIKYGEDEIIVSYEMYDKKIKEFRCSAVAKKKK